MLDKWWRWELNPGPDSRARSPGDLEASPQRRPPPITPGSDPRYKFHLEQHAPRPCDLDGAWAGGWLSLLAGLDTPGEGGQSPDDGFSSLRLRLFGNPRAIIYNPVAVPMSFQLQVAQKSQINLPGALLWDGLSSLFNCSPKPRAPIQTPHQALGPPPTMPTSFPVSREHFMLRWGLARIDV